MSWVFESIDITGRKIHLSQERWAHILQHPEMANKLEQIKYALQKPDKIDTFEIDPKVHFYYKYSKEEKQYLFISAKYLNGEGFVITSFYTDKTL